MVRLRGCERGDPSGFVCKHLPPRVLPPPVLWLLSLAGGKQGASGTLLQGYFRLLGPKPYTFYKLSDVIQWGGPGIPLDKRLRHLSLGDLRCPEEDSQRAWSLRV